MDMGGRGGRGRRMEAAVEGWDATGARRARTDGANPAVDRIAVEVVTAGVGVEFGGIPLVRGEVESEWRGEGVAEARVGGGDVQRCDGVRKVGRRRGIGRGGGGAGRMKGMKGGEVAGRGGGEA